jgi:hypothetical protein
MHVEVDVSWKANQVIICIAALRMIAFKEILGTVSIEEFIV